ncbi:hypothetical protein AB0F81_48265 [Actinoplanes sp. NPDC024001]|uniref:hypothetical protein n=1 Tax=Actinoplanes sp. NPDC024001 TaxID=3154598 RepID=UPI0033E61EBB
MRPVAVASQQPADRIRHDKRTISRYEHRTRIRSAPLSEHRSEHEEHGEEDDRNALPQPRGKR